MDIKKLKKAYHTGKLSMFLDDLLAKGEKIDKEEIEKHLKEFEKEKEKVAKEFKRYIDKEIVPTVDVLFDEKASEEQKKEYTKQRDYSVERAKGILIGVAKKIATKQDIKLQNFNDYAHELTGLSYFLDQDIVFKKREWKVRQMKIMEQYGCSRKEAEDYSIMTTEYVDYKNASNLRKEVENFIINARRVMSMLR